jgi:hypothetical protein
MTNPANSPYVRSRNAMLTLYDCIPTHLRDMLMQELTLHHQMWKLKNERHPDDDAPYSDSG